MEETSPALRADAARNRMRILAAASDVFAERGLDASTAEIARRAGVGEATLFRRFPSKDDLIVAILAEHMDGVIAPPRSASRSPTHGGRSSASSRRWSSMQVGDRGALDAVKDECMTSPALAGRRKRVMELMSRAPRAAAQDAGVVRDDLTAPDLGLLTAPASSVGGLAFPGLRTDLWRRYLGVILDGHAARGRDAAAARPAAPARVRGSPAPVAAASTIAPASATA